MSLMGQTPISSITTPKLSDVRLYINQLLADNSSKIDYSKISAVYNYENNEIGNVESFKKCLKTHTSQDVLYSLVNSKFDYKSAKKQVMVSFFQKLYTASIDPKHYSEWIKGDINLKNVGEYGPVYISSVNYGRAGYILVETEESAEKIKNLVEVSVNVSTKVFEANAYAKYTDEFNKLLQNNKVKIMILGGPSDLATTVNNFDTFKKFVEVPNAESLVKTSVPISYKVRRLADNTEVEVKDFYTEVIYELKD